MNWINKFLIEYQILSELKTLILLIKLFINIIIRFFRHNIFHDILILFIRLNNINISFCNRILIFFTNINTN